MRGRKKKERRNQREELVEMSKDETQRRRGRDMRRERVGTERVGVSRDGVNHRLLHNAIQRTSLPLAGDDVVALPSTCSALSGSNPWQDGRLKQNVNALAPVTRDSESRLGCRGVPGPIGGPPGPIGGPPEPCSIHSSGLVFEGISPTLKTC